MSPNSLSAPSASETSLEKAAIPVALLQRAADDGRLFQKPIGAVMHLLAAAVALAGPFGAYQLIDGAGVYALAFALGLTIGCIGAAQALLYRAQRIWRLSASRGHAYPITPTMLEVVRAFGEASGVYTAITGFAFGLQVVTGGSMRGAGLGPLAELGWAAMIAAPIAGFLTILLTHFLTELLTAVVAIANNTAKSAGQGSGAPVSSSQAWPGAPVRR